MFLPAAPTGYRVMLVWQLLERSLCMCNLQAWPSTREMPYTHHVAQTSQTSEVAPQQKSDQADCGCRFISVKYKSLDELPEGAVIGSAALRRQAQLLNKYPTLKIVNFRGNVQSRIRKLQEGQVLLLRCFQRLVY